MCAASAKHPRSARAVAVQHLGSTRTVTVQHLAMQHQCCTRTRNTCAAHALLKQKLGLPRACASS